MAQTGMAQTIEEIMTLHPMAYPATTTLAEAARAMRDNDMGDVLVEQDGEVCGIVTDRDIVVRAVAEGMAPDEVRLGDICSRVLTTLEPGDSVEDAVQVMRERALRRLPIRSDGHVVGIVSLGDLAMDRDPRSVLADISAMPPNN